MAQNPNESREEDQLVKERVQELTWALLDAGISDDELPLLESLLLSDETARSTYIGCVQLHSDLQSRFSSSSANASTKGGAGTQVLGDLGFGSSVNSQAPAGDQALY